MHVYDYLTARRKSLIMRAFKSLKSYKYFVNGLVTNVSLLELDPKFPAKQDDEEVIAVKCSWFSSLKAKTSYNVSLMMEKSGNVLAAKYQRGWYGSCM